MTQEEIKARIDKLAVSASQVVEIDGGEQKVLYVGDVEDLVSQIKEEEPILVETQKVWLFERTDRGSYSICQMPATNIPSKGDRIDLYNDNSDDVKSFKVVEVKYAVDVKAKQFCERIDVYIVKD